MLMEGNQDRIRPKSMLEAKSRKLWNYNKEQQSDKFIKTPLLFKEESLRYSRKINFDDLLGDDGYPNGKFEQIKLRIKQETENPEELPIFNEAPCQL